MNLYFLGGGNMASAIISGLYKNKLFNIFVTDKNEHKLNLLKKNYNVNIIKKLPTINSQDILFLAIKPQNIKEACLNLNIENKPLIISIVAGINIKNITKWTNNNKIIRAMPNLPVQVLKGISGLYANCDIQENDINIANSILQSVGKTVWVENEKFLDAFTSICSVWPGCIFYLMDKIAKEACNLGFSQNLARTLVLDTFKGSVALAEKNTLNFKQLQDKVASKGGVTQAALNVFDALDISNIIHTSIQASLYRSEKLSDNFG